MLQVLEMPYLQDGSVVAFSTIAPIFNREYYENYE